MSDHSSLPLNNASIQSLGKNITVPQYDRRVLVPGIVHFGVGGFNRSHLAVYLDDLLHEKQNERWAECGVGLLAPDERMHSALEAQDNLYSVISRDAHQVDVRVIGSLTEHIYAPAQQAHLLKRLTSPECRIVSLTVTEGGYFIANADHRFSTDAPEVQHDRNNPTAPRTFLGFITAAAERRMRTHGQPFTVMSCDNVQGNGDVARLAILSFAKLRDEKVAAWIEANVSFPNSMVDRITPVTTDADRELLQRDFHLVDRVPVVTEPFRQWVLEDHFVNARPRFETVGAELVGDVKPYEITKMRLLNGAHLTLAYVGALLDNVLVSDAVADEQIRDLIWAYFAEVTPIVPAIRGLDLDQYKAQVVERFANPTIRDQIMRLCSESAAKIEKFIVPSVRELSANQKPVPVIAFVVATWLFAMAGRAASGSTFEIVDANSGLFDAFAKSGWKQAKLALDEPSTFGDIAATHPAFVAQVQAHLDSLHAAGTRATLQRLLAGTTHPARNPTRHQGTKG